MNHLAVPTTVECPIIDDLKITVHNLDACEVKSCCFDYCELYTAYQIKGNLGADAGIVPPFHDKNVMIDYVDEKYIWAAVLVILKTKMDAKDLDMYRHLNPDGSKDIVNMYRFLQKMEHCNGEDSIK